MSNHAVAHWTRTSATWLGCAVPVSLLLAACGGGGGSKPAPAPAPPPPVAIKPTVLALGDARAAKGLDGQALLGFRLALRADANFPAQVSFTVEGGTGGASCAAGVDYLTPASTSMSLASGSSERQFNLQVCPGSASADKVLTVRWNDGANSGTASGTIRANSIAAGAGIENSKRLNDTGIAACASAGANGLACPQTGFAGQDAETGRDANERVVGQGSYKTTGFVMTVLPGSACVQDSVTGLVWEGKSGTGLHAPDNTYTWLLRNGANGGATGTANGGVCSGSNCDTESFVAAVNAERWCGFSDWRLPTADELSGIVDAGATAAPTIRAQFAGQAAAPYWSASPKAGDAAGAWMVDFNSGVVGAVAKTSPQRVRLVRGN
ncbi:DUF1566 domain-containing protein [Massilia sp. IC2-278]|uniref:Lcl C-terminal domain-containing protein n=1 Tax=Massilia sp. IC2-278 TaxID=2887200 RepID=UPI001E29548E|nr:DUF1566 domain-containing protein [Massilia sp. IC2-278]MCC2959752.1 DUF1566 domain-containing protein [Massilia sp. IC2-278]